jgi:hypothetical protein
MLPTMDHRPRRGFILRMEGHMCVRWESSRGPRILRTSASRSSPNIQNLYNFAKIHHLREERRFFIILENLKLKMLTKMN